MPQPNALSRCTAQTKSGRFCDADSLPEAPFPICLDHAAKLIRYVSKVADTKTGGEEITTSLDLFRRFGAILGTYEDLLHQPTKRRKQKLQVYYVELAGLVKIGYTADLKRRMTQYPPMSQLLAVEPGGLETEAQRHRQFARLRQYGPASEWFAYGDDLRAHIESLKATTAQR